MRFYHGTSLDNVFKMMQTGRIKKNSFFADTVEFAKRYIPKDKPGIVLEVNFPEILQKHYGRRKKYGQFQHLRPVYILPDNVRPVDTFIPELP